MADSKSTGESLLELGKLYFAKCDFVSAEDKLKQASSLFRDKEDVVGFLGAQNILLRIYAERDDEKAINATKEVLQDLVLRDGVELTSRVYYTLGTCARYKSDDNQALDYYRKALAVALANGNQEDMCYAINGIAVVYMWQGKYQEALKEIYNLKVFFEVLDVPDIRLASLMLNATILRRLGNHEEAIEIYSECFELLKSIKSHFLYLQLLYSVGVTHQQMGELDTARFYISLARKSIDTTQMKRFAKDVDRVLTELGVKPHQDYDIIFNPTSKQVTERRKGKVDLKNQFILVDLLNLFVKKPGEIFSKEQITERLWSEGYDPSIHDNKIYVTIKRLRQLIEPDVDKPRYIFRAKNGYYLNKDVKVMLEH